MRKLNKDTIANQVNLLTEIDNMIEMIQDFGEDYIFDQDNLNVVNSLLKDCNDFLVGIYDECQNYYDERSENWQEGDKGEEYSEWMEEFNEEIEEIDTTDTDEVIDALEGAKEILENLRNSPND